MAKLMGPFTPFLAEYMYQILKKLMPQSSSTSEQELSVHFQMIPKSQSVLFCFILQIDESTILFRTSLTNKDIERAVAAIQTVIGLGRVVRERKVVPMKVIYLIRLLRIHIYYSVSITGICHHS